MMLNLERQSQQRIKVDVTDDDGRILTQKLINIYSEKDIKWLHELNPEWNIPDINGILRDLVEQEALDGESPPMQAYDYNPPPGSFDSIKLKETIDSVAESTAQRIFTIHVRELNQQKKNSIPFNGTDPGEVLKDVLSTLTPGLNEPLIEWTDKDTLCVLDVDYHNVPIELRPSATEIQNIVSRIRPTPYCWHPSHGMGAKLYFLRTPGFSATELSAVAGLNYYQLDPRCTFDLSKSTRHPLYKRSRDGRRPPVSNNQSGISSVNYLYGSGDLSSIRRLLNSEVEYDDIQDFLIERGWYVGQTLPHSQCPINPGYSSDETKENVFVGDTGLFCHRCYGRGLGSPSNPGFTSYGSLIGSTDNRIKVMVKNFCHLEHAKVVLQNIYPQIPLSTLCTIYEVLLKIVHSHDDPRIQMTLRNGKGFIRGKGVWISVDGETNLQKGLDAYVRSLPAVCIPTEDDFKLNIPATTAFLNTGDISEYGYSDVSFIRGCRIYGVHLPYPENDVTKVVLKPDFHKVPPTYKPKSQRTPINEAWDLLDEAFPGIDHNYVKLLIASKGASEGRLAQCPYLLVTGPAGSGKTTTVNIVAGICGEIVSEPIWVPHIDRFRQSLMDAARTSGFICINEVFKNAISSRLTHTQALDPMLSLTEESRSHVMYTGSVAFGRLPVIVLTDISVPQEVTDDMQIARRFIFYRLQRQIQWSDTLVKRRIRPHQFRKLSAAHNEAADSILSDVIDTFFQEPMSLQEIAQQLDVVSLESYNEDVDDKTGVLLRFYQAVIESKPVTGPDAVRYNPLLGWKRIDRIQENELNRLWNEICDGQTPETWCKSRIVESEDWSKILKVDHVNVLCEMRAKNGVVILRFRSTDSVKFPTWINGKQMTYQR